MRFLFAVMVLCVLSLPEGRACDRKGGGVTHTLVRVATFPERTAVRVALLPVHILTRGRGSSASGGCATASASVGYSAMVAPSVPVAIPQVMAAPAVVVPVTESFSTTTTTTTTRTTKSGSLSTAPAPISPIPTGGVHLQTYPPRR